MLKAEPLNGIEILRILGNLHFANKNTLESKIASILDVRKNNQKALKVSQYTYLFLAHFYLNIKILYLTN
jgi:hypothetical protein